MGVSSLVCAVSGLNAPLAWCRHDPASITKAVKETRTDGNGVRWFAVTFKHFNERYAKLADVTVEVNDVFYTKSLAHTLGFHEKQPEWYRTLKLKVRARLPWQTACSCATAENVSDETFRCVQTEERDATLVEQSFLVIVFGQVAVPTMHCQSCSVVRAPHHAFPQTAPRTALIF